MSDSTRDDNCRMNVGTRLLPEALEALRNVDGVFSVDEMQDGSFSVCIDRSKISSVNAEVRVILHKNMGNQFKAAEAARLQKQLDSELDKE